MHNSSTASNESKQVQRQESGWKSTVAGLGAAAIATLVGHPMDTMKVRLQNSHGPSSLMHIVRHTFRHEGVAGFYKGVVPPLLGRSWIKAVNYGTYGGVLGMLQVPSEQTTLRDIMIAAGFAGIAATFAGAPTEVLKIRLQTDETSRGVGGAGKCLAHILREEGPATLFRGTLPYLIREGPYYVFYFGTFEYVKRNYPHVKESTLLTFLLGGVCGVYPWVLFYPADTLKSKMMCRSSGNQTMSVVLANTIKADGARGLPRSAAVRAPSVPCARYAVSGVRDSAGLSSLLFKCREQEDACWSVVVDRKREALPQKGIYNDHEH
eukprot:PhM_4_TR11813/c0_g1_i1/m.58934